MSRARQARILSGPELRAYARTHAKRGRERDVRPEELDAVLTKALPPSRAKRVKQPAAERDVVVPQGAAEGVGRAIEQAHGERVELGEFAHSRPIGITDCLRCSASSSSHSCSSMQLKAAPAATAWYGRRYSGHNGSEALQIRTSWWHRSTCACGVNSSTYSSGLLTKSTRGPDGGMRKRWPLMSDDATFSGQGSRTRRWWT